MQNGVILVYCTRWLGNQPLIISGDYFTNEARRWHISHHSVITNHLQNLSISQGFGKTSHSFNLSQDPTNLCLLSVFAAVNYRINQVPN